MFDQTINGIHVQERENPVELVDMTKSGAFVFGLDFTSEFMLRRVVCEKLEAAQKRLPQGYRFKLYEAFRPRSRQILLWDTMMQRLVQEHPDWSAAQYQEEAEKFVANPHGFGSGHQAGAAVDITLCTELGEELFMGTAVQEFNDQTKTDCTAISPESIAYRSMLCTALEAEGVVNYPAEWWHFSYGDRLWAEVTKRDAAFFAPID